MILYIQKYPRKVEPLITHNKINENRPANHFSFVAIIVGMKIKNQKEKWKPNQCNKTTSLYWINNEIKNKTPLFYPRNKESTLQVLSALSFSSRKTWYPGDCKQVPAKTCESHRKVTATDWMTDWATSRLSVDTLPEQAVPNPTACLLLYNYNHFTILHYWLLLPIVPHDSNVCWVCMSVWRGLRVCFLELHSLLPQLSKSNTC